MLTLSLLQLCEAATIIIIVFTDKKSEACRRQNDSSRRQVYSWKMVELGFELSMVYYITSKKSGWLRAGIRAGTRSCVTAISPL